MTLKKSSILLNFLKLLINLHKKITPAFYFGSYLLRENIIPKLKIDFVKTKKYYKIRHRKKYELFSIFQKR
jgi:hypothetical protein